MHNQWQTLLNNLPTALETQNISPESGYIACLTNVEILNVTGPDRLSFLQGQMTCDFTNIEDKLLLGANCNLKGRASATFYAIDTPQKNNGTTSLILPTGQAAHLKGLLDKYAPFSNAELTLNDQEYIVLGLIGEQALSITGITTLVENQSADLIEGGINQGNVSRVGNTELFLCLVTMEIAQQWLHDGALEHGLIITNQNTWDQQQIASGISHITTDSQDLFIPQELNYDLIEGISFTKGCYKGQEIIARLHYRGSYKQRAHRFLCNTNNAPAPGTAIYSGNNEQPCGHVIQSTVNASNDTELIAVIKTKALESEPLHLEQKDGPILHSLTLPYAITNKEGIN